MTAAGARRYALAAATGRVEVARGQCDSDKTAAQQQIGDGAFKARPGSEHARLPRTTTLSRALEGQSARTRTWQGTQRLGRATARGHRPDEVVLTRHAGDGCPWLRHLVTHGHQQYVCASDAAKPLERAAARAGGRRRPRTAAAHRLPNPRHAGASPSMVTDRNRNQQYTYQYIHGWDDGE